MALACYACGKVITGKVVHIVPPNIAIQLGKDFPRSYHPACYRRAGGAAERVPGPRRRK